VTHSVVGNFTSATELNLIVAKCTRVEVHLLTADGQGPTLVHFSAQRKRFLWHRGCVQGLFKGEFRGCQGVLGGVHAADMAQMVLRGGREVDEPLPRT
jgi:hypothetical protein